MQYFEDEDLFVFVFPHSAKAVLDQGGGEDLVDQIRAFYDSKRNTWLEAITDFRAVPPPPRHVTMPKIVLEIGAPGAMTH